jgi:hypothetical protein
MRKFKIDCGVKSILFVVLTVIFLFAACSGKGSLVSDSGEVDWNRYYSTEETNSIMRSFTKLYPGLTKMYSIGKSLKRADLWVIEVTNMDIKTPKEKPGMYIDGNIHSGELTGSAVTLYTMAYLLNNFGKNQEVTNLLSTRTFYFRPKFNPDGADLALLHDVSLRSTVKPFDNDGDGIADDDPPEDLNGDGYIVNMLIPDPNGRMKKSEDDPRILVRKQPGDTGTEFFRSVSEGIDNDGDGRLNEDGIGGLDLNRNFPRNWELQYLQGGAGAFPLSEPETYATIEFLNEHRNITSIVHNHTSGGFVYRLPSTADPSTFPPDDLDLILTLGDKYTELTGRPVRRSYTTPERHRYGTLISWAYWDMGVIGWVPEYWPGIQKDYDGDSTTSEAERLRFDDEELDGKYFIEWEQYDHPEFGTVEIGGWRRMFTSQNPPSELLEQECALQVPWILYLAGQSPLLEMTRPKVTPFGTNRFQVEVTVSNSGFQPTNLTERGIQARVVKPVEVSINLFGCTMIEGDKKVSVGHLKGTRDVIDAERKSSATVRWIIQKDAGNATFNIKAVSEKAGTVSYGTLPLKMK